MIRHKMMRSAANNTPSLYDFTNATFDSSIVGSTGPSLAQAISSMSGTGVTLWNSNTDFFDTSSGIQLWTVPQTATYTIEVWGARGSRTKNAYLGGYGAKMKGDFKLISGEIIKILVGQTGGMSYGGGGGGTFVVRTPYTTNESILVIAGGGNSGSPWGNTPIHASSGTAGVAGTSGVLGGTNGSGGNSVAGVWGGGGFLTGPQGTDNCSSSTKPSSFQTGGFGGLTCNSIGGFGCGSGSDGCCYGASGAGGGYSGGGGTSSSSQSGGAGGSYNNGTNQININGGDSGAYQAGNGLVIITKI